MELMQVTHSQTQTFVRQLGLQLTIILVCYILLFE